MAKWLNAYTHGETSFGTTTPEYRAWQMMKERCYNPKKKGFKNWGGRGIIVCEEWKDDPSAFIDWLIKNLGRRPSLKHSLGRINNNGNYEPGNLEWQTQTQQIRNSRITKLTMVEAREIRMLSTRGYSQRDLAREFGVSRGAIQRVLNETSWKEG